ncbi:alpha/beta fold hydrolase [Aliikangiella marina]|uniref:Alpha/beta fold hydrolase n=1 Tax=Aliikangiella marina TaxID=1712262 RepID=A0A545T6T5_9GAMM|nr:alpha/beta fold hydrolase [Aliikangiella marina]TQV72895.1 alpha/beta fold hydrolase [Aliikangiella marina]
MGIKLKLAALCLLTVAIVASFYVNSEREYEVIDTRYNGIFRTDDGALATISVSSSERFRVRYADNGRLQAFYHYGKEDFQISDGLSKNNFSASGRLNFDENGIFKGAGWNEQGVQRSLERIPLEMEVMNFQSGGLSLRGKLVLPSGNGPFPVVIMVHGSEDYSAVDHYHLPYLLAANGIAGFKFDKRGTGLSEGDYTQNFPTLAGDIIAAIEHLKRRSDIDPNRVNLAGLSQGGWIAPYVAKQTDIQSIMIGFGAAVSVPREDRWGYVYQLQNKGFSAEEIALADAMNAEFSAIIDHNDEQAWDRLFLLIDQYGDSDWFKAIVGSDSILGIVSSKVTHPGASLMPGFGWKLYYRWFHAGDGPGFNRTYNPQPTLAAIDTPSLWLLAEEDSSIPTQETVDILQALQTAGKPIQYKVYKDAEHGNILFETKADGSRHYTHYAPTYLRDIVNWFRHQNGVDSLDE